MPHKKHNYIAPKIRRQRLIDDYEILRDAEKISSNKTLIVSLNPQRCGVVERVGKMAKTPTCCPHVAYTTNLSPNERLHVAFMSTTPLYFQ